MTEARHIPGVLTLSAPEGEALPLMFDSPHNGTAYPDDFNHDCPRAAIRWGEDSFIDEIYEAAPRHGAWLLAAGFPRTYIDPNRGLEALDPALIEGTWPHPTEVTPKTADGIGLIWQNGGAGVKIYDRLLSVAEVEHRIDACWRPYHAALTETIAGIMARHGQCWHVNCHSMFSVGFGTELGKKDIPVEDVVLGNIDGRTCGTEFTEVVAEAFRGQGLSVAVNKRFKGGEIVRKIGDPAAGCHSLQIELDRGLYMDERRMVKSADFAKLQGVVTAVIGRIADYVRSNRRA
jgi:N-formylglutamate deformylase